MDAGIVKLNRGVLAFRLGRGHCRFSRFHGSRGTTQAGLDVLDSDGQLAALLTNVLRAARDRGRELADIARGEG